MLLDHLTKGRFMLGLGPGALPSDAAMIGLDMPATRELLEDALDVIVRLWRATSRSPSRTTGGTYETPACTCGRTPTRTPEIAVAAVASPAGPRLAGRYGLGLLSIGATTAAGFDVLGLHWDVMEERAAHYGVAVDRDAWRLVGLMHIAETREQAYRDVEHGIADWFDYFQHTAAFPQMDVGTGTNVREFIDFVNESRARHHRHARRRRRADRAAGQAVERRVRRLPAAGPRLGAPAAKCRSYELFARHVARGSRARRSTLDAKARARAARAELAESNLKAVEMSTAKYQAEHNGPRSAGSSTAHSGMVSPLPLTSGPCAGATTGEPSCSGDRLHLS